MAPNAPPVGFGLGSGPVVEYWNTALTARVVLDACRQQGVDTAPILAASEIDQTTIDDPEGRVTLDQMRRFWQSAVLESKDPAIGLHAGVQVPRGIYGLLDHMFSYSETIGDGLTRFGEYAPLINNWAQISAHDEGDRVHVRIGVVWGAVPRTTAEYIAALLVDRSRMLWGNMWAPELARFEFAEPEAFETPGEHARVLRCPVEFGAPVTELVLSRATWEEPVRTSDPGLIAFLEKQADEIMARLPTASSLVDDVRAEVQAAMAGGDQRIDEIADRLGTTGRTLQRNLAKEGITFAEILDEVRVEAAKVALADLSMPLAHVAYYLGFEEQSSFSRAFKRWTGTSPKDYRQSLTAQGKSDWPDRLDL